MLITDMVMPGLGGLELAKSALKLRPGLAVVLLSMEDMSQLSVDSDSMIAAGPVRNNGQSRCLRRVVVGPQNGFAGP